jgi:hypothetical protein
MTTPMFPPAAPPAAPAAPTAPAAPSEAQLNSRIKYGDPNFPKELWGRTIAEAMRFYSVMREDFMRRNDPRLAPTPEAPPQAPAAPPAWRQPSAPPSPPAPAAPAAPGFDMESMQRMIAETVARAMAPLATQQAETTHERMRREYPDWMTYEQGVLEALQGASPEQLANPDTWRTAYFYVKGKVTSSQPPAAPAAPAGFSGQWSAAGAPIVTPPPTPPNNEHAWFTEGPSAPPPNPHGAGGDPRNDPRVLAMARKHGIPVEEYVLWMNGNVPPMPGTNGGGAR